MNTKLLGQMKTKELVQFVTLSILSLLLFMGISITLFTEEASAESRTVTIHKKKYSATQTTVQNTGKLMPAFDSVEGLNGIEFKVYDFTTEFYALIDSGKTVEEAQASLATASISGKTALSSGTTATVSNEDGVLSLTMDSIMGGKNAVYSIVETAKDGVDRSGNLIVAFPVYEVTGMNAGKFTYGDIELTTIHLYPKNVVTRGSLEIEKKSTAAGKSVDGAQFVIHRKGNYGSGGTEYYKQLKANGIVEWTTDSSAAKLFTIASGKFKADGLEFGSYFFTETVPPANHGIINAQAVNRPFTINATTLNVTFTGAQAILNDGLDIVKETGKNANGNYDYNVGDAINYKITVPVPLGIADKLLDGTTNRYKKFQIVDTHDKELTLDTSSYLLMADSTTIPASAYDITPTATGFTIVLKDGFQTTLNGKLSLVFTYKMKLNEQFAAQTKYQNKAAATLDYQTDEEISQPVTTYGKRFTKVDTDRNSLLLSGATFVIRSADSDTAKYLKQTTVGGKVSKAEWTDVAADRTLFTTNASGVIDILGLNANDYWLEEVTAPNNYVKLTNRIKFTTSDASYFAGDQSILTTLVMNKHKGSLPATGGLGIYLTIGAGVFFMAGTIFWFFRRKRSDELVK